MKKKQIQAAVRRVEEMERCLDLLQKTADENPTEIRSNAQLQAMLRQLTDYYENGRWMQDYALDEQGLLPADLKRGVLSEDAVYDLLAQIDGILR